MTGRIIEILKPVSVSNSNVVSGDVPGQEVKLIIGRNPDVDALNDEDLWHFGGDYTFSSSAVDHSISSSNAGDTQTIRVVGLDANYNEISVDIALAGQAKTTLATNFLRINCVMNVGSTDLVGDVYVYESTATVALGIPNEANLVRGKIAAGVINVAEQAVYTVPAGKSGFISNVIFSVDVAVESVGDLLVREEGQVFRLVFPKIASKEETDLHKLAYGIFVPEKSDIKMRVDSSGANASAAGGFEMLIKDNN